MIAWFRELLLALRAIAAALQSIDNTLARIATHSGIPLGTLPPIDDTPAPKTSAAPLTSDEIRELRGRVEFAQGVLPSVDKEALLDQFIREIEEAQDKPQFSAATEPDQFPRL